MAKPPKGLGRIPGQPPGRGGRTPGSVMQAVSYPPGGSAVQRPGAQTLPGVGPRPSAVPGGIGGSAAMPGQAAPGKNPAYYTKYVISTGQWVTSGLPTGVDARADVTFGVFDMRSDLGQYGNRNGTKAIQVNWWQMPISVSLGPRMNVLYRYPGSATLGDNAEDQNVRIYYAHMGGMWNSSSFYIITDFIEITNAKGEEAQAWVYPIEWPLGLNFWGVVYRLELVNGAAAADLGPVELEVTIC